MKALFYKECRLALHPTALLFLALSAMVLIPNYPYYVTFFYTCLGVFFICLTGRENHNVLYTLLLPVPKRAAVQARMLLAVVLQLAQAALVVPFICLKNARMAMPNLVGMDANIAFWGISFLLLGLFNLVFFTRYYHNTDKVGVPFGWGCLAFGAGTLAAEGAAQAAPFVRDRLDTPDPQFLPEKLLVLAAGLAAYALLTWIAYRRSTRLFEKVDL